jgi:hypothetical protein
VRRPWFGWSLAQIAGHAPPDLAWCAEWRVLFGILLSNRGSRGSPWKNALDELPIFHNRHTVDKHKLDALGVLEGIVVRGFVDDASGVEDGDVGVGTDADSALGAEDGRALLEALCGHEGHLAERGHQVEGFLFADVVA